MWRWIVVVGALGLVASPVGAQAPEGLDRFVGCYAVELGAWAPSESRFHRPPEHVRLTEELGEEPLGRGRLLARPVIPHGRTPSAWWSPAGDDGVEVVWTNGFAGVSLHLEAVADGTLEGIARLITDAQVITEDGPEPLPETEAVLRPIACPDGEQRGSSLLSRYRSATTTPSRSAVRTNEWADPHMRATSASVQGNTSMGSPIGSGA